MSPVPSPWVELPVWLRALSQVMAQIGDHGTATVAVAITGEGPTWSVRYGEMTRGIIEGIFP